MSRFVATSCLLILLAAACTSPTALSTTSTTLANTERLSGGLPAATDGVTLEVGTTYLYPFGIHCGMTSIFAHLNGVNWATRVPPYPGNNPNMEFREFFTNPNESVSPVLRTHITLVSDNQLRLTLPDGTYESTYHPTDEDIPPCA